MIKITKLTTRDRSTDNIVKTLAELQKLDKRWVFESHTETQNKYALRIELEDDQNENGLKRSKSN